MRTACIMGHAVRATALVLPAVVFLFPRVI